MNTPDPTAGERVCARGYCGQRAYCDEAGQCLETGRERDQFAPPAVAASTGTSEDVEALAEALWDAMPAHHVGWRGLDGQSREFYRGNAERFLASDWLAAREAAARAEERERIVRWLRTGPDYHQRRSEIARHIREG